ncbi:hypothetical protein Tco_1086660 [Tanacetum coccineum]
MRARTCIHIPRARSGIMKSPSRESIWESSGLSRGSRGPPLHTRRRILIKTECGVCWAVGVKNDLVSNLTSKVESLGDAEILKKFILFFPEFRVIVPLSNLISTLAVVKNGVPKMKRLFSSSFMFKITKSTGYTKPAISINTSSAIPKG